MLSSGGIEDSEVPNVLMIGKLVDFVGMEPKTVRFYEGGLDKAAPHRQFACLNTRCRIAEGYQISSLPGYVYSDNQEAFGNARPTSFG